MSSEEDPDAFLMRLLPTPHMYSHGKVLTIEAPHADADLAAAGAFVSIISFTAPARREILWLPSTVPVGTDRSSSDSMRLMNSMAISESNPSSLKGRSGAILDSEVPSTLAMAPRIYDFSRPSL